MLERCLAGISENNCYPVRSQKFPSMGINLPRGAQKSVWRNNATLFLDKSLLWADKWPLSMSEIRGNGENGSQAHLRECVPVPFSSLCI